MDTPDTSSVPKPDLFAKVGPLPAWGWGLIVVAAYLGYRRFAAMRKPVAYSDPANVVTDATMVPTDSFNDGGGSGGGGMTVGPESSGYNYSDVLAGNYTGTTSGAVFSTNQQWGVYAINNLPKVGYPAGEVASAITFYLAGMPLTAAQGSIVEAAIRAYGSPPLPLPLTTASPAVVSPTVNPDNHIQVSSPVTGAITTVVEPVGNDPERPGQTAYLNEQGYRDLNNPANYPIPVGA